MSKELENETTVTAPEAEKDAVMEIQQSHIEAECDPYEIVELKDGYRAVLYDFSYSRDKSLFGYYCSDGKPAGAAIMLCLPWSKVDPWTYFYQGRALEIMFSENMETARALIEKDGHSWVSTVTNGQ